MALAASRGQGELTQLPGTSGCVSVEESRGACARGRQFGGRPVSIVVSRDGKNVYVAGTDVVGVFRRAAGTGALAQLPRPGGCVGSRGDGPECTVAKLLDYVESVAISPDGRNVYVATWQSNGGGVTVLSRDPRTGLLKQLSGRGGCVRDRGGNGCADGKALGQVRAIGVSPDGRSVYVASWEDALAVFSRDARTGALEQLRGRDGCVSEEGSDGACADGKALGNASSISVSSDGRSVYVASEESGAVAVFARDRRTGGLKQLPGTTACVAEDGDECAPARALAGAKSVTVTRDGRSVYAAFSFLGDGVAAFSRDIRTGALTPLAGKAACITSFRPECARGRGLGGAAAIASSSDGRSIYVASEDDDAVAVFARDPKRGALTQLAGKRGCISGENRGSACTRGRALTSATAVTVSRDGRSVYVAGSSFGGSLAVFARQR
jgi:DNA-binding beta-propeller fold protein YncE